MTVNLMIKAQTTRKLISREHVCGAEEYLTQLAVHVRYNSRRDGQSLYNHTQFTPSEFCVSGVFYLIFLCHIHYDQVE